MYKINRQKYYSSSLRGKKNKNTLGTIKMCRTQFLLYREYTISYSLILILCKKKKNLHKTFIGAHKMHAQFLCSLLMFLRIYCLIPKVFINQSYFFEATMLPVIIPMISPNPYPTKLFSNQIQRETRHSLDFV